MNKIKNITYRGTWLAFMLAFIMIACEPDNFELDSDDPRDNITDTWNVTEYSKLDTLSYLSEITKHPTDSSRVRINYFYGLGYDIDAIGILNEMRIVIPQQTLDGIDVQGNGSINFNYSRIEFNYSADDGSGFVDQVRAVYTRN